ncbi:hypothetical protein Tco_0024947 [Tanacetum coccineum]
MSVIQPTMQMGQPVMSVIQQAQPVFPSGQSTCLSGPTSQPRNTDHTSPLGQAATLSHAFNIMTLQDPASGAWNMDTRASSHLNDSVTSLSNVFNTCIYPSVSVGDGHTILVTNTGHKKPPVLCHALQLGKHVMLPFVSSNTSITSRFDIIHSDV